MVGAGGTGRNIFKKCARNVHDAPPPPQQHSAALSPSHDSHPLGPMVVSVGYNRPAHTAFPCMSLPSLSLCLATQVADAANSVRFNGISIEVRSAWTCLARRPPDGQSHGVCQELERPLDTTSINRKCLAYEHLRLLHEELFCAVRQADLRA